MRLSRRVGMFWPKNLLPDPERFLVERLGFGVLAHILVQLGQVIEAGCRQGMFWPKDLLPDLERFLVERFGFRIVANKPVQQGQVIEAGRRVGMFWPKNLLPDPERFLKSGSALAYSPISWYSSARLLRLVAVSRDVLAQEPSGRSGALPG